MPRQRWIGVMLVLAILLASFGGRAAAQPQQAEPASAGIIVSLKVTPGQKPEASLKHLQSFASAKMSVQATQLISQTVDDEGLMVLPVPTGVSAMEYAARFTNAYTGSGVLAYAEPNWIIPAPELTTQIISSTNSLPTASVDKYSADQWALQYMHVSTAWAIQPKATALVGFVDSGYDTGHEDLPPLAGWNDFTDAKSPTPVDEMGHGTHTAGIACAVANNGKGIAGIGNGCPVVMARVFNGPGTGAQEIWIIRALDWLRTNNVRIASLSLGRKGGFNQSYFDAVKRFQNAGGIVIAAAGNDGKDEAFWPAQFNGVISVASLDSNGQLSSFSNRGSWVTIAAPGGGILSTVPTSFSNPAYQSWSGTSMAAPQVTGVVALMRTHRPSLNHDQIVDILRKSAQPFSQDGVNGGLDAGAALVMTHAIRSLYLPFARH